MRDELHRYVPCTPGGSVLFNLARPTEKAAIKALVASAKHLPYGTWENFKRRGYEILDLEQCQ